MGDGERGKEKPGDGGKDEDREADVKKRKIEREIERERDRECLRERGWERWHILAFWSSQNETVLKIRLLNKSMLEIRAEEKKTCDRNIQDKRK